MRAGLVGLGSVAGGALHRDWGDWLLSKAVRFCSDQRQGLPVLQLQLYEDGRTSVCITSVDGRLTVDSQLARTMGLRLSN